MRRGKELGSLHEKKKKRLTKGRQSMGGHSAEALGKNSFIRNTIIRGGGGQKNLFAREEEKRRASEGEGSKTEGSRAFRKSAI